MKRDIAAHQERGQKRVPLLHIPLLALAVTLVVELFNHKAFTAGPGDFLKFITGQPLAALVDVHHPANADACHVSAAAGILLLRGVRRVAAGRRGERFYSAQPDDALYCGGPDRAEYRPGYIA